MANTMGSTKERQPDTQAVLAGAINGEPDALQRLAAKACGRLREIAGAVTRGLGSPDRGINGESDLAQSVAGDIIENPGGRLSDVYTSDDLNARLHKLLYEKWVTRCRAANTLKRGAGMVVQATQVGQPDAESPLDIGVRGYGEFTPATPSEVAVDVKGILETFKPDSQRRQILELVMNDCTQEEIGRSVGLSRDAVGRRIRSMGRSLQERFGAQTKSGAES